MKAPNQSIGSLVDRAVIGAFIFQVALLSPSVAVAQAAVDVVGTWTLVSSVTERDGTKTDQFGLGAKGLLMFDSKGRFMLTIIGPNLPRFASNNRAGGTPQENKAVASGASADRVVQQVWVGRRPPYGA